MKIDDFRTGLTYLYGDKLVEAVGFKRPYGIPYAVLRDGSEVHVSQLREIQRVGERFVAGDRLYVVHSVERIGNFLNISAYRVHQRKGYTFGRVKNFSYQAS
jgi:hypothetical protein